MVYELYGLSEEEIKDTENINNQIKIFETILKV